jgi:hypothetical protein
MAKKGLKNQTKRPIVANRTDTSLLVDTDSAATTESSPLDMLSPTRVAFRNFIELADVNTINIFLAATTSTLESENLEALWKRAYKEGFENGQKAIQPILQRVGRKLEEKFEKGVARGMDLGREEGYTIAKGGFDNIVKALKARDATKVDTTNSGTQTDSTVTTTISVQTAALLPANLTSGTQTSPTDTISHSTTSASIQTNPVTLVTTSQFMDLLGKRKNTKFHSASEISPNIAVFSPQIPSVTVLDPLESTTITTVLKTRSTMADLTENCQKNENPPIFSQNCLEPFKSPIPEALNWAMMSGVALYMPNSPFSICFTSFC